MFLLPHEVFNMKILDLTFIFFLASVLNDLKKEKRKMKVQLCHNKNIFYVLSSHRNNRFTAIIQDFIMRIWKWTGRVWILQLGIYFIFKKLANKVQKNMHIYTTILPGPHPHTDLKTYKRALFKHTSTFAE